MEQWAVKHVESYGNSSQAIYLPIMVVAFLNLQCLIRQIENTVL